MKKAIIFFLIIFSLSACTVQKNEQSLDFFAMDTLMSLTAVGDSAEDVIIESKNAVYEIENKISRTKEDSDIYKLNNSGGEVVEVSDITYEILSVALDCAEKTDGAFDPSICAVTDLWGIGTENARVPSQNEIDKALETVSYKNIVLLGDNKVQLLNGAKIDLGGVGKGYASDILAEIYEKNETQSGVISLAGNIYVYGEKDNNSLWNIGVTDPDDTKEVALSIKTTENSIVTTGAYERFFEENGNIYHHIFNSKTGYPSDMDIKSVTVISKNSTIADIYATALFVMGYEKAIEFAESQDDFSVVIIRDDNKVYSSENLNVTLGEKYEK